MIYTATLNDVKPRIELTQLSKLVRRDKWNKTGIQFRRLRHETTHYCCHVVSSLTNYLKMNINGKKDVLENGRTISAKTKKCYTYWPRYRRIAIEITWIHSSRHNYGKLRWVTSEVNSWNSEMAVMDMHLRSHSRHAMLTSYIASSWSTDRR